MQIYRSQQVHSLNLGQLREVIFSGKTIRTGFFKEPALWPVQAGRLGLEGDVQADLTVHGGVDKAVYAYAKEHYPAWEALLGQGTLMPGSFGENLTTEGLTESQLYIGDVFRVGETLLRVTQPRSPCFKLQIRFDRPDAVALFVRRGCPGWYASVLQNGAIKAGDGIELVDRKQEAVSIADVWAFSFERSATIEELEQIDNLELLPSLWKEHIYRAHS